jgi:hypothetical protein
MYSQFFCGKLTFFNHMIGIIEETIVGAVEVIWELKKLGRHEQK